MSYKITSFNQQTGAITVVYDEGITVSLTLVPDTEGKVITGQTLDNFILSAKPVWQIEALKHETDFLIAPFRQLIIRQPGLNQNCKDEIKE
jgi:hypothetical protein